MQPPPERQLSECFTPEPSVIGGVGLPKYLMADVVEWINAPDDELSIHIMRLIGINIRKFNDLQKIQIIEKLNEILGIKPFLKDIL